MGTKQWIKYSIVRESVKDEELNRILDKISNKEKLTNIEKGFLSKFNTLIDDDMIDYHHLSTSSTFYKIQNLLINNKVICNLQDRDGDINQEIVDTYFNYIEDKYFLILKNKSKIILKDNFLYNIIFNNKKGIYSLQEQDEYFEKLPVR